ncbi:MAG: hypothetical protein WBN34_02510 [Woeseia sp.]
MKQQGLQQQGMEAGEQSGSIDGDVVSHAIAYVSSVRDRVHLVIELAVAEAKFAAVSAAATALLVLLASLFTLGAWGLAMAGLVVAAIQAGYSLWTVLSALGLLHMLVAAVLAARALTMSRHVAFAETRRQLAVKDAQSL